MDAAHQAPPGLTTSPATGAPHHQGAPQPLRETDRQAVLEFDHLTHNQARSRLHEGRWSQAAYEAYDHLWNESKGYPNPQPFPDAAQVIAAYREHKTQQAT